MTTYYVRQSGGSDGNPGTSFAQGWATIQYAADTAVAGDVVLICADGTHQPTAQVDFDTNAGAAGSLINFRGASATGADDGTEATISGASLSPASADLFEFPTTGGLTKYVQFEYLRLTAGKAHNVNVVGGVSHIYFINCRIDNAATDGIRMDNASSRVVLTNCEIDNNGAEGIGQSTTSRGQVFANGCSIHDNGGTGIDLGSGSGVEILYCLIYDNVSHGILLNGSCVGTISNNTIANNDGNGLDVSSAAILRGGNNIFAHNGGYGVDHNGSRRSERAAWSYNLYYSNTSGNIDLDSGSPANTDSNAVTGADPAFTSTTSGSEDYSISSSSPAKAAGFPGATKRGGTGYLDIGALQRQEPAGGGVAIVNARRNTLIGR